MNLQRTANSVLTVCLSQGDNRKPLIASTSSGTLWKTPRRIPLWVMSRKKRSTMFNQDALVGV